MSKRPVKDKVLWLLDNYPATRNDDLLLIRMFWENYDRQFIAQNAAGCWVFLDNLIKMTSPESIRRCRQVINGKGLFLATDPVVLARREKEKKVRQSFIDGNFDGSQL